MYVSHQNVHRQSHQALHFLSLSFKRSGIKIHKMFLAFNIIEPCCVKDSKGSKQKTEMKIP